ncbi:MAG TPA: response regulator transcription factor [Candidatus Dormibacteraeota bacterium]|jgi:DNA-binding NarL/FixJ family response regulator|nr:response regulator transcription factor [Candidatus Dormibacteraeota bacterium]
MITILLVDDHDLVVEGFRRLLAEQPDFVVVGAAGTGAAAIAMVKANRPEVVLIDYTLPDANGAAVTASLLEIDPTIKVIMLTGSEDPRALQAALRAGCVGYLEKTSASGRLVTAIRAAVAGDTFLSAADLERLREQRGSVSDQLSERELEVLELIAAGLSTRVIADQLFITVNTVRTHTQVILQKLGAHSKLEAVTMARRAGLVDHSQT